MTQAAELPQFVVKSSEVIGVGVENPQSEKLGKIEKLVIDKKEGNIRYAVLSFNKAMGMEKNCLLFHGKR